MDDSGRESALAGIEKGCREIVHHGREIFHWQWDGGFPAALATINAEHYDEALNILSRSSVEGWNHVNIRSAPARVLELVDAQGGLWQGHHCPADRAGAALS